MRHALLALLSAGPTFGLQLRQEFEAGTGEVWPLNVGQVYTTLQRLERDGLITSDDAQGEGLQNVYTLTPTGGRELDEWLRTPPSTVPPPRDELVIKVLVAVRVPGVEVHDHANGVEPWATPETDHQRRPRHYQLGELVAVALRYPPGSEPGTRLVDNVFCAR